MVKLFIFVLILAPISFAGQKSGLRLSGVVPLRADVKVLNASVENTSSDGLKFEVKKRQPASVVVVSAP